MTPRPETPVQVLLRGNHPWVGRTATVVIRYPSGRWTVRLESGHEVDCWPGQRRVLEAAK